MTATPTLPAALHRKADRHCGAEGFAEVRNPVRVDLRLRGQPRLRGPRVCRQTFLGRAARVVAISAVVEQQN